MCINYDIDVLRKFGFSEFASTNERCNPFHQQKERERSHGFSTRQSRSKTEFLNAFLLNVRGLRTIPGSRGRSKIIWNTGFQSSRPGRLVCGSCHWIWEIGELGIL
mmetsp:Transcript_61927/g.166210  ORF Transcript_61927/g.166210 Transcript_61927/m.166210 type:complete len:106 (+) Transcript_61927:116-433(+)